MPFVLAILLKLLSGRDLFVYLLGQSADAWLMGGLSVYGLGLSPVTLYKEQWLKLLEIAGDIRAFSNAHEGELKTKG